MLQNTKTDGTEDNPEGGDAPEAGGPESLSSRDGPGAKDTESLKPQEDSGPSGPSSVTSGLRSCGGASYGTPKTAGAGRSTCSNYDGGDGCNDILLFSVFMIIFFYQINPVFIFLKPL